MPGAPVRIGNLASPVVLIAIFSFLAIAVLTLRRVPGAILLGILAVSIVAFVRGIAPGPGAWIGTPPNPAPIMFKADLSAVLNLRFFGVLLSIFVMALIDTMGSLIAVSSRVGFPDERANLPRIAQPMLCDALATVFAALAGTTTSGAFIESAAGVEAGGRTGLTAVFHRCALYPGAILRAARNRDTTGRIWPRARDHRLYDDGADHEDRFR